MLVHAPEPDVAVAQGVPPGVEHLAVEAENAFASYACWWWGERGEAVINPRAIRIADTREQVPKGERVALARIHKDDSQQGAALRWCVLGKIKTRERVTKGRRGLFKVRCARANFRAGGADRPGRDEGFVAVELEADPAHGGAQKARAGIVHVQRVDAPQIHGDRGRGVHDKLAGRRPDGGANRSALEREPLVAGAIGHQPETRASVDFDSAGFIERDCGPRGIVSFKGLSNAQFPNRRVSADGFRTDAGRAFEARHIPGRSQIGDRSGAQEEKQRNRNHQDGGNCAQCQRQTETQKARVRFRWANLYNLFEGRRWTVVAITTQHFFELLNFGIRVAGAVPQVVVFHKSFLVVLGRLLTMHLLPCHSASRAAFAYLDRD